MTNGNSLFIITAPFQVVMLERRFISFLLISSKIDITFIIIIRLKFNNNLL
jgi:hypothetical protein